jgi:hypothetical protein
VAGQKKLMRHLGLLPFKQMVMLAWAQEADTGGARPYYQPMLALAGQWEPPIFPMSGKDLQVLGYEEGKQLGQMLRRLEVVWEDSDYTLTRHELLERAKR